MNKIKIGGIVYDVAAVENLIGKSGGRVDGQLDYHRTLIEIDAELNEQAFMQALWHEILHGINANIGRINVMEEGHLDSMAYSLLEVLRDNPELMEEVKGLDKKK